MIKKLLILVILCYSTLSYGQDSNKILEEGRLLYRLEKASWIGTDNFLARFPEKRNTIGGYVSYETESHGIITIFFGKENFDSLLVRYHFDSIPGSPLHIDSLNLTITTFEKDLIEIRQDAVLRISNNSDKFFTYYKNTSFNPIPLITEKERRVFILTGPQESNIVLLGNDYLLEYNKKNKLKNKVQIHKSLLQFPYKSEESGKTMESTHHSHVVTEFITSTDICTLLLYKDYVEWKKHFVSGKKYISYFDIEKENLVILTIEAWERIYNQIDE